MHDKKHQQKTIQTMKKTYIRPEASLILFHAESSLMIAASEGSNQSDDWSNQREWNDNSSSIWDNADLDAE